MWWQNAGRSLRGSDLTQHWSWQRYVSSALFYSLLLILMIRAFQREWHTRSVYQPVSFTRRLSWSFSFYLFKVLVQLRRSFLCRLACYCFSLVWLQSGLFGLSFACLRQNPMEEDYSNRAKKYIFFWVLTFLKRKKRTCFPQNYEIKIRILLFFLEFKD